MMLLMLLAYTPSYAWPTLGYDKERSSYQAVPGANITGPTVKWRVPVTPSLQRSCGPLIYDVRGDYAGCEVIYNDGTYVKCLDGNTGSQIWSYALPQPDLAPNSTPAAGDVDNDGIPEVIVARQQPGTLICLNGMNGAVKWSLQVGNGQQIMSPICLVDVSGDNVPEIVIGQQFSDTVYCFNGNGTVRWKRSLGSAMFISVNGISAGNVDGAAGNEIVVSTTDMTVGVAKCIVCLNADGSVKWRYPSSILAATTSTVTATLGDVTGDGRLDVIVYRGDNNRIVALQGSNGSEIWTYSIPNNSRGYAQSLLFQNLVAWDVTGDGRCEVFLGTGGADDTVTHDTTSWKSWFICLNSNGSERWKYEIDYWTYDGGGAICDVDRDGVLEFVKTADDGFVYVFPAASGGSYEWRYDYYDQDGVTEWAVDNPIAVGDIDGDACSEIVLLGSGGLTGGNNITAIDGPGTGCLLGSEEEMGALLPGITARSGRGVLYLGIRGFDEAEARIWDASGRMIKEIGLRKEPTPIDLPPGIYFIEARHREVVMRGKATVY